MGFSRYFSATLFCLSLVPSSLLAQSYGELISQALELRNLGEFSEAENLFRQAHEQASDQRESYYLLAMTIAFQDRFDEAQDLLEEALQTYPGDQTLTISKARVLSFQGDFSGALADVDEVLEQNPTNTEALNLGGRVSLYQNQPSRAIRQYEQTLAIEADNLEALVGLHDAYRSLGDTEQAAIYLSQAATVDPDSLDVRMRQNQQVLPEPSWQVTYGYGNSHFKRIPLGDWYDGFLEVHRQDGLGNDLYARIENQGHFGMSDTLIALGTVRNMTGAIPWGARLEFSPDAVFVPDYRANVFIAPRLREGGDTLGPTIGNASLQYASYPVAQVVQLGLGLDQYLFNGMLWLSPSITTVQDENDDTITGWNLRANWQVSQDVLTGFGYGESPQTESAVTAITRTAHLYGQVSINDHADIRIDLVREDRENSYVRYGTTFALVWKY